MTVYFDRKTPQGTISSENPVDIWTDWQTDKECWLFVSPHDDDIVCGCGLTFTAAIENKIDVHAAVISNGRMGYCTPEQRDNIADVRRRETQESFKFLGLPKNKLYQFDYDDGSLIQERGRRFATDLDQPNEISGAVGLQNTLTWLIRKVRPTRIFMANRLDLHPDHQAVNAEMTISIFHAQGAIWPELGEPIRRIPTLYEYATYSDFIQPPNIRIRVSDDLVEKRLQAIALYKSQLQIDLLVQELRKTGGVEYLLEVAFEIFQADKYESLF